MIMTIFKHLWILILIGAYLYGWGTFVFFKKDIDEEVHKDFRDMWLLFNMFLIFLGSILCFIKF